VGFHCTSCSGPPSAEATRAVWNNATGFENDPEKKKKNEKSTDHHGPMEDPKTLDSQMILVTENYGLKLHPMVQFIITFP